MGQHFSANFRKLHQDSGEALRWWKAIPVPEGTTGRTSEGVVLAEQTLPDAARFLVSNTEDDFESRDYGLVKKGSLQISAFPDWARFNHLDRIALIAPGRLMSALATPKQLVRGVTDEDDFATPYVVSITNVWVGGVAVSASDYEATPTGIKWLGNAPAQGVSYGAEYLYSPRYLCLPQRHKTSPTDRNGVSLPIHYWLQMEKNFGD